MKAIDPRAIVAAVKGKSVDAYTAAQKAIAEAGAGYRGDAALNAGSMAGDAGAAGRQVVEAVQPNLPTAMTGAAIGAGGLAAGAGINEAMNAQQQAVDMQSQQQEQFKQMLLQHVQPKAKRTMNGVEFVSSKDLNEALKAVIGEQQFAAEVGDQGLTPEELMMMGQQLGYDVHGD